MTKELCQCQKQLHSNALVIIQNFANFGFKKCDFWFLMRCVRFQVSDPLNIALWSYKLFCVVNIALFFTLIFHLKFFKINILADSSFVFHSSLLTAKSVDLFVACDGFHCIMEIVWSGHFDCRGVFQTIPDLYCYQCFVQTQAAIGNRWGLVEESTTNLPPGNGDLTKIIATFSNEKMTPGSGNWNFSMFTSPPIPCVHSGGVKHW